MGRGRACVECKMMAWSVGGMVPILGRCEQGCEWGVGARSGDIGSERERAYAACAAWKTR